MDGTVFVFVLLYLVLYENKIYGTILNGKLKKMNINFNPKPVFIVLFGTFLQLTVAEDGLIIGIL